MSCWSLRWRLRSCRRCYGNHWKAVEVHYWCRCPRGSDWWRRRSLKRPSLVVVLFVVLLLLLVSHSSSSRAVRWVLLSDGVLMLMRYDEDEGVRRVLLPSSALGSIGSAMDSPDDDKKKKAHQLSAERPAHNASKQATAAEALMAAPAVRQAGQPSHPLHLALGRWRDGLRKWMEKAKKIFGFQSSSNNNNISCCVTIECLAILIPYLYLW